MSRKLALSFAIVCSSSAALATTLEMDFTRPCHAGYPSEQEVEDAPGWSGDGRIDTDCLPGDSGLAFVDVVGPSKAMLSWQLSFERGFPITAEIRFNASAAIDPHSLPTKTPYALVAPDVTGILSTVRPQTGANSPSVFLIDVSSTDYDYLRVYPVITAAWSYHPCDFGCGQLNPLTLTPVQGVPLRPNTVYAAVVTNRVRDTSGAALTASPSFSALAGGGAAAGMTGRAQNAYLNAIANLKFGHSSSYDGPATFGSIVALTVFKTGNPTEGFRRVVNAALAQPPAPISLALVGPDSSGHAPDGIPTGLDWGNTPPDTYSGNGIFQEFCAYQGSMTVPDYQFLPRSPGGDLVSGMAELDFDDSETPVLNANEAVHVYVTVPRTPMPPNGYPIVVFSRSGGGGDAPLISRGPTDDHPWYASGSVHPGAGPALYFARAGWAAIEIEDPAATHRNGDHWGPGDEDNVYFNVRNMFETRDTIRQAALELLKLGAIDLPALNVAGTFDASSCMVRPPSAPCIYSSDGTDPLLGDDPAKGGITRSCQGQTLLPGSAHVMFDLSRLTYMGHSVGATIGPLVMFGTFPPGTLQAGQPVFKQAILDGAGGSILNNILYKWLPGLHLVPTDEGYHSLRWYAGSTLLADHELEGEQDPQVNVVQAAQEPADGPPYSRVTADRLVVPSTQTILQFQTSLDHYITPPIANAANLSLGLMPAVSSEMVDTRGTSGGYDSILTDYDDVYGNGFWIDPLGPFPNCYNMSTFMPYQSLLPISGWSSTSGLSTRNATQLPVRGRSALVPHHNGPFEFDWHDASYRGFPPSVLYSAGYYPTYRFQDGHENVFQSIKPRTQYQCFLKTSMPLKLPSGEEVPGSPIIRDDKASGDNYLSCCDHSPLAAGKGLYDNCSCCAATVCRLSIKKRNGDSFSTCCDQGLHSWDQECAQMADSGACAACGGADF